MIVAQAGGVVVVGDKAVLRRTPKGEYLFPKGHIEPGETPEQTAVREVAEETGLEAAVVADLGRIEFPYQGDRYQVDFFLMRAVRQLPEWQDHLGKDTVLLPFDKVRESLSFQNYRDLWDRAKAMLRG